MTYDEALLYLAGIEDLGSKLALENITQVLTALGEPQLKFPSLLISGTNGKGSVASMLASVLRRAGFRTGLYTSPHLIRYEERVVVDGTPISAEAFAGAIGRVHDAARDLLDRGALKAHPTHFETVTAAAFHHLAEARVDLAVLEVGMGGRLDATVLARPRLSLITNVSLEHTAYLGETIGAIASEKAGILTEGGTLLTGETHPEAIDAFRKRAAAIGGRLIEMATWAQVETRRAGRLTIRTPRRTHEELEVGLRGPHQIANAALAAAACDLMEEIGFDVPLDAVRDGLKEARWPGRFQVVEGSPRLILDGAHNPAGCRALRAALAAEGRPPEGVTLLFGVLRDKDYVSMMRELFPAASRIVLTRGAHARFREPSVLLEAARRSGLAPRAAGARDGSRSAPEDARSIVTTESVEEGLIEARRMAGPKGTVCAAGSLYLVGEAMRSMGIEPWPTPGLLPRR